MTSLPLKLKNVMKQNLQFSDKYNIHWNVEGTNATCHEEIKLN